MRAKTSTNFEAAAGEPASPNESRKQVGRAVGRRIMAALRMAHRVLGMRRKRRAPGLPASGRGSAVAGVAAAVATALTFSLADVQTASAQVYINDGTDSGCSIFRDIGSAGAPAATLSANAKCNADAATQTTHSQFNGPTGTGGATDGASRNLSLGGNLYVNAGQIGVTDILNQTFSMRMGSVATMNGAAGVNAIAIGSAQTATGNGGSTTATVASGANTIAIGSAATAGGAGGAAANAIAIGSTASASQAGAIAFGLNAQAGSANSVALGADSVTATAVGTAEINISGATYTFAGATPSSTVSIGAADAERTLTNLAAGRVNADSTDAVNGSQLFAATQAVETVGSGLADTAAALGGGASYNAETGAFTGPSYSIGGAPFTDIGSAFAQTGTMLGNQGAGVATALGGGATYNPATGAFTSPTYTVGDGTGGTTSVTGVGGAIGNLDGRTASNETAIGDLSDAVNSGTIGLVQQADPSADVTVAATSGGTVVDFTGTDNERVLTGVAAGAVSATSIDAINGSQLFATNEGLSDTAAALGGGAGYDAATGTFTGPSYSIGGDTFTDVGSALAQTDTILGNQGSGVAAVLGGGASYNPATGAFTGPTYTVGDGTGGTTSVTGIGDAIGNIDGRTASNETAIGDLSDAVNSGSVGLVQQADPSADVTVAAATGGTVVDFTGADGERALTGVADGEVSATSTDAINGSQLFATNEGLSDTAAALGSGAGYNPATGIFTGPSYSIGGNTFTDVGSAFAQTDTILGNQGSDLATALGGGASYDAATGTFTSPIYLVGDGAGGTTSVTGAGNAVANLNGRTTSNETAIVNLTDAIAYGAIGLVQQAGSAADLTVASFTGGTAVDFTGTAGERVLTGVAAGDVSATSTDVVNGSQLFATNEGLSDTAAALGGGASYDAATGTFTGPTYTVGDGASGTTTVTGIGDAIGNLDGRTASNEAAIGDLSDAVNSGTIGLVQQADPTADVTVAAASGGTAVDFTGTEGERALTGVAAGEVSATSTDAINGSQLQAANQSIASALGGGTGLNPDGTLTAPQYDLGGTTYNDVGGAFGALQGQIDTIQSTGIGGVQVNTTQPAASATGSDAVALGGGASAGGSNATALGTGASAGFDNSTAIGAGAATSRNNQVAIGTGQNTYTMAGIASDESRAAQSGPLQVVTSDGNGNLATADIASFFPDIGGIGERFDSVNRKLDRHSDGIAIALALGGAYLPQDKDFALAGNVGFFNGTTALAFSGIARVDNHWSLSGGIGIGFERNTVAGRAGATFAW